MTDDNDDTGASESPLDDLFVEGARFREPSAAERAAWAKEQRKQVAKSKRRRRRENDHSTSAGRRRPLIAIAVLFVLAFVIFYVFNPGGGGGGSKTNNADALAGQPREVAAYYAVPQGAPLDPGATDAIRHDIIEAQQWLASQTDGKVLRFKQSPDGAIDVQLHALPTTEAELKSSANAAGLVHDAFIENGHEPSDIVLAFVPVDRGTDCGQGQLGFAVVYMGSCNERPSTTATWPGGDTKITAHELIHSLGAVAPCAPHYGDNGHVVDNKNDLMYPETGGSSGDAQLDPGHDDYYKHHIKDCIDVADHPAWTTA